MSRRRNILFISDSYPVGMATFLLRVALPDRPGALGAVASRIGAVRADVVAVDIVGRGRGRAVDEFVVELGDERHVSLLLDEIAEVDGVVIEEVRVLPADVVDRRMSAFDAAEALMGERTPPGVLRVVAERSRRGLDATWAAVLDPEDGQILAVDGDAPAAPWLAAYVAGTRWYAARRSVPPGDEPGTAADDSPPAATDDDECDAESIDAVLPSPSGAHAPAPDVAWAPLRAWDLVVVVGRPGRAFTEAERRHLAGVARLADARWTDLADRDARSSHPSRVLSSPVLAHTP